MSNVSKEILGLMQETRRIFQQISALLSTADGLMGEGGWDAAAGSTCLSYSSSSINLPKQWIPYEAFRFYKKGDSTNLLLFICIMLDAADRYELTQSLITAGCFDYGEDTVGNGAGSNWHYWWPRFHCLMKERTDDGVVYRASPKEEWPAENYPFNCVSTFAWPLTIIADTSDLKEKIVGPLLRLAGDAE